MSGAGGEGRFDQRGEGGEVRAHDDHVASLERGVGGEEVEDGVTEDLDLATGPVAHVHLDGAVVTTRHAGGDGVIEGRRPIGADVVLQAVKQRRVWCQVTGGRLTGHALVAEHNLELA